LTLIDLYIPNYYNYTVHKAVKAINLNLLMFVELNNVNRLFNSDY